MANRKLGARIDRIDLLDHGYVELVDSWGSEERIVEAARMSTQKGFQGWGPKHIEGCISDGGECTGCVCGGNHPGDEKLLRYLWEHKHMSPFEMAGMTFEVQAPIFVFREWHRHRTQSYNEMSARYAPLPDLNYVPTVERILSGGGYLTKQAGTIAGSKAMDRDGAANYRDHLRAFYALCQSNYDAALKDGVPKELARLVLPVGRYSRMRASANLRNWLQFLELRLPEMAQWEIREYAGAIARFVSLAFPRTLGFFSEGRKT